MGAGLRVGFAGGRRRDDRRSQFFRQNDRAVPALPRNKRFILDASINGRAAQAGESTCLIDAIRKTMKLYALGFASCVGLPANFRIFCIIINRRSVCPPAAPASWFTTLELN